MMTGSTRSSSKGPTAFDHVSSVDVLRRAWDKVVTRGGGPGGDGESISDFAPVAEQRIARLSREMQLGFYRPGPLRHTNIPKKSGGLRGLSIPCVIDRIAQRAAADLLHELLEPHFEDASYGYRPGRSVQQAIAKVAELRRVGYQWVVDGDIRSFFDEVPHDIVTARLAAHVPDNRFIQLVALWLETFSNDDRGLAQGSPISPILSNLHLDAIDEALDGKTTRLVRFADDFVILTKTQPKAQAALKRVAKLLADVGLELNQEKTRIVGFDQAFKFLGHLFVRTLVMQADEVTEERFMARSVTTLESLDDLPPVADAVATGPKIGSQAKTDLEPDAPAEKVKLIRKPRDPIEPLGADQDTDDLAAGLAPLYILEQGRRLAVENESLAVIEDDKRLVLLPPSRIGRIDLGSLVEADDRALRLAAAYRIPVHFLDGRGQPEAVLWPAVGPDASLHMAQAQIALDPIASLAHVRVLVAGRLRNEQALLKRLNQRTKDEGVQVACDQLHAIRRRAELAASIDVARGYEGEGASVYWPALGRCLKHDWRFTERIRDDDKKDEVNAVLDWTASLLARDVRAAVLRAGLHPGFGVLHVPNDRRDACVFDLIEEFRAPLSEGFTVYLFNNRNLTRDDFTDREGEKRVTSSGGQKLIREYERWLGREITNPRTKRRTTWRGLILLQARALARAAREQTMYAPYELDY